MLHALGAFISVVIHIRHSHSTWQRTVQVRTVLYSLFKFMSHTYYVLQIDVQMHTQHTHTRIHTHTHTNVRP
jgi:ubiquitin-protein ligase